MTETIAIQNTDNPYGAFELKKLYPKNYSIGLTIAVIFHIFMIGVYFFAVFMQTEDEDNIPIVRIMKYSELGPPPSISNEIPPQVAVSGPVVKPTVGIPVPVPDASVSPEQTLASQEEMSNVAGPTITEGTGGGGIQITQDIKIEQEADDNPDMDKFVAVEKMPEIVVQAKPVYPDLAIRANLEGRVWVKILVSKEGKPKKAVVVKSDAEIFNQSAIDAAMKYAFTPALQNHKPVAVWVVVPFKFELRGN
ncbi:MAG: hypothetical protein COW85_07145 [Ignavibacteria bacterium CG22_combo_CG10-13_8_21_14_all_37_15]|nr:TonB family protein [Ignavibacteria bacterium]PIP77784.1 MAG: hypothetical protein COW85_07145 [Ignavibacteria bacterium CG22_combo_CG10-13_8_21_14_all_37_15]